MDRRGQRTQGRCHEQRADRRDFGPATYLSYIAAGVNGWARGMYGPSFVFTRYFCPLMPRRGVADARQTLKPGAGIAAGLAVSGVCPGSGRHSSPVPAQCTSRCGNRARRRRRPRSCNTLQAQIASRETVRPLWPRVAGLSRRRAGATPCALPTATQVIKLKSSDPVTEPFVTLLVEVNWARGQLVREYTMLLDPPVYTPGSSAVASAP